MADKTCGVLGCKADRRGDAHAHDEDGNTLYTCVLGHPGCAWTRSGLCHKRRQEKIMADDGPTTALTRPVVPIPGHPTNYAVLKVMTEYASAFRGDYSQVDGRSVQYEILEWVTALNGDPELLKRSIEDWRARYGLCPHGEGHWTEHCSDERCGRLPE